MSKIKDAFEIYIDEEYNDLHHKAEVHKFSKKNERKILSYINTNKSGCRRIKSKKLMTFLVAAIILCLATVSVGAYQIVKKYTNPVKEAHKDYTEYKSITNDNDPTEIDTIYELTNPPKDYFMTYREKHNEQDSEYMVTTYENTKDYIELELYQYVKAGHILTIGGPYMKVDEFTDENAITYHLYDWGMGSVLMIWEQDGYAFELYSQGTTNFNIEKMKELKIKKSDSDVYFVQKNES